MGIMSGVRAGSGAAGFLRFLGFHVLLLSLLVGLEAAPAGAQHMPKQEYIRFVPLEYPRIVRETEASVRLHLYGDRSSPGYRDVDPRDGIDDERGRVLEALAYRFAPFLVQNTATVPMDHRRFMDRLRSWPIYVDTWDLVRSPELVHEERIDLAEVTREPCPHWRPADAGASADCRLLALLDEFDPDNPVHYRALSNAREADADPFKVMYMNPPGEGEESWKAEYTNAHSNTLPDHYRDWVKAFVHPFIHEVRSEAEGTSSYELVLQYWFYYPSNDGGNNHEGDWEHLGVYVTPLSRVGETLDAGDIQSILDGSKLSDETDPLVIAKLDYYIHTHVMPLDLSRPNAYLPREEWEAQVDSITPEFAGQKWVWSELRRRVWADDAETVINTHPLGYIGGDNKGTDQILRMPGGSNRDSHATYPFAGLYKDIGPAGASEDLRNYVDLREYLKDPSSLEATPFGRGWVLRLDEPGRLQVVPDWERIHPLLAEDVEVRKEWSWLILPLRWGYPAIESPFAGVVAHAETGNLAPVGPAYSTGWNRPGPSAGFTLYEPHRFSSFFALGWQDTFLNTWGFLNGTLPTLSILPPVDFAYRVLGAPIRLALGRNYSTFFDNETIPYRFVGVMAGGGSEELPRAFSDLIANSDQLLQIIARIQEADPSFTVPLGRRFSREGQSAFAGVNLYVGRKFESENVVRHVTGVVGEELALSTRSEPYVVQSDLNLWEYAGSLRYNLNTGRMQPFGRIGWGWSWYRLENLTTDGLLLDAPNSPWVDGFTWHYGLGFEFLPVLGSGRGLGGMDAGLRVDLAWYRHKLGTDQIADPVILAAGGAETGTVVRRQLSLALTLSF
jgi:hypothetical protein